MARRRSNQGHLAVVLLVGIAVSSIMLAMAVEPWQTIVKRDREEELIFRGEQYVEAIRLYQAKMGSLPVKLEDLQKRPTPFIRKLYKDPMTKDEDGNRGGEWGLIHATPTGQPILPTGEPIGNVDPTGQLPGGTAASEGGTASEGSSSSGSSSAFPSSSSSSSSFGTPNVGGPILGVYSKSDDEALKLYDGNSYYNEWYFYLKPEQPQGAPGTNPGGGGAPGGTGGAGGTGGTFGGGTTGGTTGGGTFGGGTTGSGTTGGGTTGGGSPR